MKLWLSVLSSAAVAVGTVAIYDHIRGDEAPERVDLTVDAPDASGLEARVAALEAQEEPLLTGRGDEVLLARIEELERRLHALESMPGPAPAPPDPKETAAGVAGDAVMDPESAEEPGPDAVDRFRKLRGMARRDDLRRHRQKQVEIALEKLDFTVTERQREQLAEALEAFDPHWREIWGEAKNQPEGVDVDWKQVVEATHARLQSEFADRISPIVPHRGDAVQLAGLLVGAGAK